MKHTAPSALRAKPAQRGVVLVITLVLLVVFALLGAFAIRNATQSERVMNSLRANAAAQQAAEIALRFCEQVAQAQGHKYVYTDTAGQAQSFEGAAYIAPTPVEAADAPGALWKQPDTWAVGSAQLISVPEGYYESPSSAAVQLKHAPQCVIEQLNNANTRLIGFIITGRGYANNAIKDAKTNKVSSGAESWLQSTLVSEISE